MARSHSVALPLCSAALIVAVLGACLGDWSFVTGRGRSTPTHRSVALHSVANGVAPGGANLKKFLPVRVFGNMWAAATAPVRLMKLGQITKDLVQEMRDRQKAKSGGDGEEDDKSEQKAAASSTLKAFLPSYIKSHVIARTEPEAFRHFLNTTLNVIIDSIGAKEGYDFQPYHKAVRGPGIDFYAWGNDFFRSMVKFRQSKVEGVEHLATIQEALAAGDNVVFLANHQTEADPQVLSLLLEAQGVEDLAEKTIFIAGHKVTTDRLAIPFSMGRNLLTIFSKKYLDTFSPEEKEVKQARNQKTVSEMQRLFQEGGHVLWVAPSGGRDRRTGNGGTRFEPAKFDEQSVGLFCLLGQKAEKSSGKKTRFFPLAMWSHKLVPPPEGAQAAVGESRSATRAPIGLEFGPELVLEEVGGRKGMAQAAEAAVRRQYDHLDSLLR
mmetsp:Transcript_83252/g.239306  ORF Transcript_83252/g.239306 Transcript_83252/m.239306 type:complete len:437 (-) Transcript_83252:137-1447(-)